MTAHQSVPTRGRLTRWRESLLRTGAEQEAVDALAEAERYPATRIDAVLDRSVANICGTVRSVTLPPRTSVPMLVAEVWDGTKALNLVWLGRRAIGGIEPGVFLRASGRVTFLRGVPTIYNPAYALVPRG